MSCELFITISSAPLIPSRMSVSQVSKSTLVLGDSCPKGRCCFLSKLHPCLVLCNKHYAKSSCCGADAESPVVNCTISSDGSAFSDNTSDLTGEAFNAWVSGKAKELNDLLEANATVPTRVFCEHGVNRSTAVAIRYATLFGSWLSVDAVKEYIVIAKRGGAMFSGVWPTLTNDHFHRLLRIENRELQQEHGSQTRLMLNRAIALRKQQETGGQPGVS